MPDEDPDLPGGAARPLAPRLLVAVAIGGALGALARYGLGEVFPVASGSFPATTVAINLTGAFLLALLVASLAKRPGLDPVWQPLLGTGVLGGYTTFSTFAVDADRLTSTGHAGLAVGYVAATVLGGAVATALGMMAAG